jgi:hypothetical protein
MLRPTISNLAMVTIMAMVGIYAIKALTRTVNIPGLSDLAGGI